MLWFSRDIPGLELPQVFLRQLHPGAMRTNWKILEKRVNFSCRMREHEISVCRVKANGMQSVEAGPQPNIRQRLVNPEKRGRKGCRSQKVQGH